MIATKGYGLSVENIDMSSPADMKPYLKAHREEIKEKDCLAWMSNQYTLSAVSVAIERCFAGKKAKSKYIEKPILQSMLDNYGLTEEEIIQKEIQEAILFEEKSMVMSKLPKTVIKQ